MKTKNETIEAKHTPRPWHEECGDIMDSNGNRLFRSELFDNQVNIANSRLAAAAPELLEAAKMGLLMSEDLYEAVDGKVTTTYKEEREKILSAIAKAEGGK